MVQLLEGVDCTKAASLSRAPQRTHVVRGAGFRYIYRTWSVCWTLTGELSCTKMDEPIVSQFDGRLKDDPRNLVLD